MHSIAIDNVDLNWTICHRGEASRGEARRDEANNKSNLERNLGHMCMIGREYDARNLDAYGERADFR